MFHESEREFVVTRNANIKPVSYFTGRETELQDLRQRIEEGKKSVLVSGMGGIGKTHICRKLFEEYLNKHAEDGIQGEYEKAKELYEKSLRIREKICGEEHPETAASYTSLAMVYDAQGKYQKAMTF